MRKSNEEILEEYFRSMNIDSCVPDDLHKHWLHTVEVAREYEPRINSGIHYIDWINICDDDDDFDSFYGEDYFKDEDTGLEPVAFFDPHPGFMGAGMRLPEPVRLATAALNGTIATLDVAMKAIKESCPVDPDMEFSLRAKNGMFLLEAQMENGTRHMWRVLSYQSVNRV